MIAIMKHKRKTIDKETEKKIKRQDIIVTRPDKIITEIAQDGTVTEKKTFKKVNLTKLANETAKLVKVNVAEEKLAEMRKALEAEERKVKEMKNNG